MTTYLAYHVTYDTPDPRLRRKYIIYDTSSRRSRYQSSLSKLSTREGEAGKEAQAIGSASQSDRQKDDRQTGRRHEDESSDEHHEWQALRIVGERQFCGKKYKISFTRYRVAGNG